MRSQSLIALFTIFLLAATLLAQESAQLKVDVIDKSDHVISDAYVIASYQELIDGKLVNKQVTGTTDTGGSFDTTIYFEENSTPASHMFIQVYQPYWSSPSIRTQIPIVEPKVIEQKIKIPIEFETYRLRVSADNGTSLSAVNAQLLFPFFASKKTEANGIVQFRVPKGIVPYELNRMVNIKNSISGRVLKKQISSASNTHSATQNLLLQLKRILWNCRYMTL